MDLNLKNFKKVGGDENHTIMKHIDEGHELKIKHALIDAAHVRALKALPTFNEGGMCYDEGGQVQLDPDKVKAFTEGFIGKKQPPPTPAPQPPPKNYADGGPVPVMDRMADPIGTMSLPTPSESDSTASAAAPQQEAAPTPQANPDPYGMQAYNDRLNNAYQLQMAGIAGGAEAAKNAAAAQGKAEKEAADATDLLNAGMQSQKADIDTEVQHMQKAYDSGKIDPDRYINNMDPGKKTRLAIGMILAGFNPTASHNPVIEYLHNQIQNDVEAQKADLDKKHNLLTAAMAKYGNLRSATEMAQVLTAQAYAHKIKQAALANGSQGALASGLAAAGELMAKYAPLAQQTAMRQAVLGGMANGTIDPATAIQYHPDIPEGEKPKLAESLGKVQELGGLQNEYQKSFQDIHSKFMNGLLSPHDTSSAINLLAGKLSHATAGRYNNEEAMKLMQSILPQTLDSAATAKAKLGRGNALFNVMKKEHQANLDRFGIKAPQAKSIQESAPVIGN